MVSFTKLVSLPGAMAMAVAQDATTIRYMPLGDSITEIVCWREKLWRKLQDTEWATVNWVGSGRADNNCSDSQYDRDNEGHSGFLAIDIADQNQLVGWLRRNPTDVITMHLGTNDIGQQNKPVNQILAAFAKLVQQIRESNPRMKIIVAQIIPMDVGSFSTQIQALNSAVVPWARERNTSASPIWVVDHYTGFGSDDLRDGIHPNDSGDTKMANVWYPAVMNAFAAAKADKVAAAGAFEEHKGDDELVK